MSVRPWVLAFVLAVTLVTVACGSGTSASGNQGDVATSGRSVSAYDSGAWNDYRDSLLAWADDLGANSRTAAEYEEENAPSLTDSSYSERVERNLEDLDSLEQLNPPPELLALHQKLVEAFRGFCEADELYLETQIAKNYLAGIRAGIKAQQQLGKVNSALLELIQTLKAAE